MHSTNLIGLQNSSSYLTKMNTNVAQLFLEVIEFIVHANKTLGISGGNCFLPCVTTMCLVSLSQYIWHSDSRERKKYNVLAINSIFMVIGSSYFLSSCI